MEIKEIIINKLKEIETKENIRIIFAIESGSRAWGFASYDSDYDVRFVYVRKKEDYLKLNPFRDVIEWELDDTYDINGWDIQKALKLVKESNPTIFEWVNSPIIYYQTPEFLELKKIINDFYICKKGVYHYLHMAKRNSNEFLQGEQVKLKKYFYVLRPLLASKWIIDKKTCPPMEFQLLVDTELNNDIKPIINKLLELKKNSSELGTGERIEELNNYINERLLEISNIADLLPNDKHDWQLLNDYFINLFK